MTDAKDFSEMRHFHWSFFILPNPSLSFSLPSLAGIFLPCAYTDTHTYTPGFLKFLEPLNEGIKPFLNVEGRTPQTGGN